MRITGPEGEDEEEASSGEVKMKPDMQVATRAARIAASTGTINFDAPISPSLCSVKIRGDSGCDGS